MSRTAIIIGAGPAGLTAAYELLKRTDIVPIIIEKCDEVGGISKTIEYKGNRMDFGPHRFFSKSDRVMTWWADMMPLYITNEQHDNPTIHYQNRSRTIDTGNIKTSSGDTDRPPAKSMLILPRLTRIYFLRKFFKYPIQLTPSTLKQLGLIVTFRITCSYLYARVFPRKPEKTLEDFMINRFGKTLYLLFFKDYTEKVWGVACNSISAEWGAQRIKGVSLSKALVHASRSLVGKKKGNLHQKNTETSMIEQFLYPAKGAGSLWEEVAGQIRSMGGKIFTNLGVEKIISKENQVTSIETNNSITGEKQLWEGNYFFSTMPVQELVNGMNPGAPAEVRKIAGGLMYRDFIYACVLVKKLTVGNLKDNWIYIQEKDVKVARIQLYNNWGPYMVKDPGTVWLGLEYFCNKGDDTWQLSDEDIKELAIQELVKMNLVRAEDVLDSTVQRMEKTYPSYTGSYDQFSIIREYLDNFTNLFLVGRNGMHKYNNADHSMLTAMTAVDNIIANTTGKENIWGINTEQDYQEVKS